MILFVNGCVREDSRTLGLANAVLSMEAGEITEVCLYPDGPDGINNEELKLREELIGRREYSHPMFVNANIFANADTIVIAAPYWDLMFPTKVRAFIEEVTVSGITFRYNEQGIPQGLCKAGKLVYVTTAGGPIYMNFGFEYVRALAQNFYGISDVRLVKAEGLDVHGADVEGILAGVKKEILAGNY